MRFRHGHTDEGSLQQILKRTGQLRAQLRFIHLRTHREAKARLTAEQIARYKAGRGYDAGGGAHQHGN